MGGVDPENRSESIAEVEVSYLRNAATDQRDSHCNCGRCIDEIHSGNHRPESGSLEGRRIARRRDQRHATQSVARRFRLRDGVQHRMSLDKAMQVATGGLSKCLSQR